MVSVTVVQVCCDCPYVPVTDTEAVAVAHSNCASRPTEMVVLTLHVLVVQDWDPTALMSEQLCVVAQSMAVPVFCQLS